MLLYKIYTIKKDLLKTRQSLILKFIQVGACLLCYGNSLASQGDPKKYEYSGDNVPRTIVTFSIHEHHRPLLNSTQREHIGLLGQVINHLEEELNLRFKPIWRSGSDTGQSALNEGQVDFIIDPPIVITKDIPKELVIADIFQSQGVLVSTEAPNATLEHHPKRIAYLSGIADFSKIEDPRQEQTWVLHQSIHEIYRSFIEKKIDAAVLPLRLLEHQLAIGLNLHWHDLYGIEPVNYSWVFHPSKVEVKKLIEPRIRLWQKTQLERGVYPSWAYFNYFNLTLLKKWGYSGLVTLLLLTGLLFGWICKLRQEKIRIIQQSNVLAHSNNQAIQANQAKSNFLATVSHEIRTPMHAILGVQEILIQKSTIRSEDRTLLQSSQNAAKSLLEILNQVLDISKYEAGKLQIKERPTDLGKLIHCTMQTFESLAKRQNISCQISIDEQLASSLLVDDLRLRQILQNLLSNSIKFTQEGYVSISCKVLNNTYSEQWVEIHVADTGIGIADTEIERLLKPYEQSKVNDLSSIPGTGLGLSITSELLKSLNSELVIESQKGLGTTASFLLHLKRSSAKPRSFNSEVTPDKTFQIHSDIRNTNQQKIILIVDDHEASREVLRIQVAQLGYHALLAEDAQSALLLAKLHQPAIMITDETMPGMSGRELANRMRESYPEIGIIGITANIFAKHDESTYLDAGMDCVLVKPINLNELRTFLKQVEHKKQPLLNKPKTWDLVSLKKYTGENHQLACQIIRAILCVQKEFVELIARDISDIYTWAHKIRGGAQLIGANDIETICLQIETANTAVPDALLKTLNEQLTLNNQELEDYLTHPLDLKSS